MEKIIARGQVYSVRYEGAPQDPRHITFRIGPTPDKLSEIRFEFQPFTTLERSVAYGESRYVLAPPQLHALACLHMLLAAKATFQEVTISSEFDSDHRVIAIEF